MLSSTRVGLIEHVTVRRSGRSTAGPNHTKVHASLHVGAGAESSRCGGCTSGDGDNPHACPLHRGPSGNVTNGTALADRLSRREPLSPALIHTHPEVPLSC